MKKCTNCGSLNLDDSKFCSICGRKVDVNKNLCPLCKKEIDPTKGFCKYCGRDLSKPPPLLPHVTWYKRSWTIATFVSVLVVILLVSTVFLVFKTEIFNKDKSEVAQTTSMVSDTAVVEAVAETTSELSTTENTIESTIFTETIQQESAQTQVYNLNIFNGVGTPGIAITVKNILEDNLNKEQKTIVVKEIKDADKFNYDATEIIIHTDKDGMSEMTDRIKEILGVGVISESSSNPGSVDITIIIGSDYTK